MRAPRCSTALPGPALALMVPRNSEVLEHAGCGFLTLTNAVG
ncbi:hypothetical protein BH18ACT16_BH18ACT16_06690 [soil metagenome]